MSEKIDNIEPDDEQGKYLKVVLKYNKNFKMELVRENDLWQYLYVIFLYFTNKTDITGQLARFFDNEQPDNSLPVIYKQEKLDILVPFNDIFEADEKKLDDEQGISTS